ncbi:hypothetical protein BH09VER1_BH09VER1_01070 [soil metagenome]
MRIIIDENVPHPLLKYLAHHKSTSVQAEGWSGIKNGELLRRIDGNFDVFILGDKNLQYQQNLSDRRIAIVELPTIRWPLLLPLIPDVVTAVDAARPGSYTVVGI